MKNDDLIIALRGKIGQVAKVGNELIGSNLTRGVALIALKNIYEPDFFLHQLSSDQTISILEKNLNGSALQELSIGILRKIPVIVPENRKEQILISKLFNTWNKYIDCTSQLIIQNEQRKKWLMQQLLSGKKRLKGFEKEKWKKYSYNTLLKTVKRPVVWNDNELYKLISVRRRSGGIFLREALYGKQILVKDLRTAKEGDFLFSKMQIVHGASTLVTKEFDDTKISGSYIATVAADVNILDMEYFNWYSKLPYFYHQTYISSYGVHIEKMTFDWESFLSLELKLPQIKEQKAIVQVLNSADKEIVLLQQKLSQLKEQKKGLMQVLLTGKKRLKIK